MKIIGIDPGSIRTGFAVLEIEATPSRIKYIASGTIMLEQATALHSRLLALATDFGSLLEKYKPEILVIESLFFARNAQSALKLGHARGVLLMKAASENLEIVEYAPAEIKSAVTGSGRADKTQVAKMIKLLLKLPKNFEFSTPDQSDALAIAMAHVQSVKIKGLQKNDRSAYWQTTL